MSRNITLLWKVHNAAVKIYKVYTCKLDISHNSKWKRGANEKAVLQIDMLDRVIFLETFIIHSLQWNF